MASSFRTISTQFARESLVRKDETQHQSIHVAHADNDEPRFLRFLLNFAQLLLQQQNLLQGHLKPPSDARAGNMDTGRRHVARGAIELRWMHAFVTFSMAAIVEGDNDGDVHREGLVSSIELIAGTKSTTLTGLDAQARSLPSLATVLSIFLA